MSVRKEAPKNKKSAVIMRWFVHKRRLKLTILTSVCLIAIIYGWLVYANSPDQVIRRAIAYLNTRDAEGLVSLASERERRLLNLTPDSVRTCLRASYWKDDSTRPEIRPGGFSTPWADIRTYAMTVTNITPDAATHKFAVDVYQYEGSGWYLSLSLLLYTLTKAASGKQGMEASQEWDTVAKKAGIVAVVTASSKTRYTNGSQSPRITLTHD